jgi:hypothetical protein
VNSTERLRIGISDRTQANLHPLQWICQPRPDGQRRSWIGQFGTYGIGKHDNGPASATTNCTGSEARAFKIGQVLVQIPKCEIVRETVGLEEPVELIAGGEAEEAAKFEVCDVAVPVFVEGQRFECATRNISEAGHSAGDVVGGVNGQFHT